MVIAYGMGSGETHVSVTEHPNFGSLTMQVDTISGFMLYIS